MNAHSVSLLEHGVGIIEAVAAFDGDVETEQGHGPFDAARLRHQRIDRCLDDRVAARKLEASYAGMLGKSIEPAIRPLGYDWKIGIALLSSFAAREVFNGTMYTIYSLESVGAKEEADAANQSPFERYGRLRRQMTDDKFENGDHIYTLATGVSLLIFYALAMQCMSTLAVVRRETGSWKWPAFQFLFMSGLAYLAAWLAYTLLS